jgi:hypothetical protein
MEIILFSFKIYSKYINTILSISNQAIHFDSSQEKGINSTVLIVFAHEGNNIPEAMQLVNYLNEWKDYLGKVFHFSFIILIFKDDSTVKLLSSHQCPTGDFPYLGNTCLAQRLIQIQKHNYSNIKKN